MSVSQFTRFGGQSMVAPLRRALLVAPDPAALSRWEEYGWRSAPDPERTAEEHAGFAALLRLCGVEVQFGPTTVGDPDSVYAYDPALVTDAGAVILRSGKPGRRGETPAAEAGLAAMGVPVLARMQAPGTMDGGDTLWLDSETLLVGRGYRTNDAGIAQLRATMPSHVEVIEVDLPHFQGEGACFHLMSLISPVAEDVVVAFPSLLPVRLMQRLAQRSVEIVEVDPGEFDRQGCNVLAVAPRVAVMVEGNPVTQRRLEAAGVEVRTFPGEDLCVKGDGGPTCLTRPVLRAA